MDAESAKSRELGCWDGPAATSGFVTMAGDFTPQPPDFEPGDAFYDFMMEIGFGKFTTKEIRDSWAKRTRETYRGDDGKRRVCMAAVALAGRDSLHGRLPYIKCPVLWLQVRKKDPCTSVFGFLPLDLLALDGCESPLTNP